MPDGTRAHPNGVIATVRGRARVLLAGERVALNFLQRMSGIATLARRAVDAVAGTGAAVTDTRKTTPGLRALEKYAVRMGGGVNHRLSLADAVLWKDNHWQLLGPSGRPLRDVLAGAPAGLPITVEVESDVQLEAALAAGARRVLVDNQPPDRVAAWVRRAGPGVAIEASGGITPETAAAYAKAGARYISIGALTHSARAVGIRFELSAPP
jgi:nicotinate-nucleotide pyrophosphorylase (carboxylating)